MLLGAVMQRPEAPKFLILIFTINNQVRAEDERGEEHEKTHTDPSLKCGQVAREVHLESCVVVVS